MSTKEKATECPDCGTKRGPHRYSWDTEKVHEHLLEACRRGFERGLVVGVAIVNWAEAIRKNAPRAVERDYWTSELDGRRYYTCGCPGCGVQMKRRRAGEDEGTDNEWCGICRG